MTRPSPQRLVELAVAQTCHSVRHSGHIPCPQRLVELVRFPKHDCHDCHFGHVPCPDDAIGAASLSGGNIGVGIVAGAIALFPRAICIPMTERHIVRIQRKRLPARSHASKRGRLQLGAIPRRELGVGRNAQRGEGGNESPEECAAHDINIVSQKGEGFGFRGSTSNAEKQNSCHAVTPRNRDRVSTV